MQSDTFTLTTTDGTGVHVYRWLPAGDPKAVVQLAHGMAEHAARYQRLAEALTAAGYAVYADDHRGHGRTAATADDQGFFAEADGWRTVVADLAELTDRIKQDHPGLPVFFLGHSMGSMLGRGYACDHSDRIDGLVLSGTAGDPGGLVRIMQAIAAIEGRIRGRRAKSTLLDKLSFGNFNKAFAPNRTGFDWLSRDDAEVDKYVADPECGFVCSVGLFQDLGAGMAAINNAENLRRIRKDLPIYLFSGDRDPVGGDTKGVRGVADAFRNAGVKEVTERYYPDGRHEMFNETNRDEVTEDLIGWLDAHLPGRAEKG